MRTNPEPDAAATRDAHALTRRELLALLGAGTVGVALGGAFPVELGAQPAGSIGSAGWPGTGSAGARLAAFDLTAVRLLDGPFREAQQRDARYLLSLDPDRLLHGFRVNAGLQPKAPIYGGWESEEPWVGIRCHGHTLGHYLTAASLMYASTGELPFKERVDYIVAELAACQAAGGTGVLCAFPDGSAQLDNAIAGRPFVGVPWYTMHKIFAGLRDAHVAAGSAEARTVLVKLSDWAWTATQGMSDDQFQRMLDTEHGGMNEVLADVYALTGDPRHLTLARRFSHRALLAPMAEQRDVLDGRHANTQVPKVVGFERLHELTGEAEYGRASRFFWETVTGRRSFVTGGHGDFEHFFPPADFARHLGSAKTMETCCTHNMLRLTRQLFAGEGSAAYMDFYERALYNGILASQDPDSGMMTYFQATRPGYVKLYNTPEKSFWCCTGTGMENHAKYGDTIYFHSPDALYVNLFIASVLEWRERGLQLRQSTRFPDEDVTRLTVSAKAPVRMALRVRHPGWCRKPEISVNGKRWKAASGSTPGSYISIEREWRNGDVVAVRLPMDLRFEPLPGATDRIAFVYGPVVLAGQLGREGIAPGADIIVNERESGNMLNDRVEVPALAGPPERLLRRLQPVKGEALTFRTEGAGRPRDVTLKPFFRVAHERYNLYWQVQG